MRVWTVRFKETLALRAAPVVAIGNFDGVHAGHVALLAKAKGVAAGLGGAPVVVLTFDPHPRVVVRPDVPHVPLMEGPAKLAALAAAGAEGVAVVPFTADLATWTPERFVAEVLVGWLGVQAVVVGENFRFGAGAKGDVGVLQALLGHAKTHALPLVRDAHGVISSSRLRALRGSGPA